MAKMTVIAKNYPVYYCNNYCRGELEIAENRVTVGTVNVYAQQRYN